MRLIDADALIEQIEDECCKDCNSYNGVKCRACDAGDALDYLERAPTFDPWHYPEKGDLPAETDKVLVIIKEHRIQADYIPPEAKVGRLKWNGKFFEFSHSDYFKDEIIKWMPIELTEEVK